MKIIQITDHMGSGGVNSFVYDLCQAQARAGMDVTFIGLMNSQEKLETAQLEKLKNVGVQVNCLGASGKKNAVLHCVRTLRRQIKLIAENEECICNLHLKLSVLCGVLATIGLKNVKCIETYHNNYHHYELQYALCYPFIKHYIAISKTCSEEMKRRFRTPTQKMTVIPNGIDREAMRALAGIDSVAPHSGTQIVSVGRMSYEKNLKRPVEALANICDETLQYCVIGDGLQKEEIVAAAKGNEYIEFLGWLPREITLTKLAKASLVIMPSLWEGRSILQLEAMALDKPLMLSDVSALREVFDENPLADNELFRVCSWGYLVKTNDSTAYSQACINFKSRSIKEREKMGIAIKRFSLMNDIENVAKHYFRIYKEVVDSL